jgi:parvulin-like peptidyl-prolyl isomerase
MADLLQGKAAPASMTRRARWGMLFGGIVVIGVAVATRSYWGPAAAEAEGPRPKPPASARPAKPESQAPEATGPQVVAIVNNQDITHAELSAHAVEIYGQEIIANLISREVIVQACRARKISVTRLEVEQEIERLAERFGLSTDRWLSMLKEERGVTPSQYGNDIIWPSLALRKLAAAQLEITPEELQQAHEARYGASVKVRLIACNDQEVALQVQEAAAANPEDFARLAREHSDDPNSASAGGLIQPIRPHVGHPEIERTAFALQPGQVSDVLPIGNQYVILKCEQHLPPRNVPLEQVAEQITAELHERKERQASAEVFQALQKQAQVERIFGDPEKSARQPGVAALVNGQPITLAHLGEACIDRYGEELLTGMITRRIVEQACQRKKVVVSQDDIDQEVVRAAAAAGMVDPQSGQVDLEKWIGTVTTEQGISEKTYVQDVVWPSVALKKLVGNEVEVTDEDLQKGFEANYGPRVRCLAIVLNNQRRAQEVWAKARENNTTEHFGDLAEQYSIGADVSSLRGEVPPIQMHGGQPQLEAEAFALKPGELSGIIQVEDKFIILRCEGRTRPVDITFEEVRDLIYQDLHEKKLRLAMADKLDHLKESAQIDNYLAGTVQMPNERKPAAAPADPLLQEETPSVAGPPTPRPRTAQRPKPRPQ